MRAKQNRNKVVTSFTALPKVLEQLKEYRKASGVCTSWLINKLLSDYFAKLEAK
mgnify:CR=1 FL=1